jgi:phosphate transport system protein
MRTRFQQGLDDLRARLLRMGGLAEQAVDRACQAYIDRDLARCHMVLEGEFQINVAEREIDELAFDLLALQQPIAVDLRFILAVTKINSDLERVGDQAVNIAERAMDLVELPRSISQSTFRAWRLRFQPWSGVRWNPLLKARPSLRKLCSKWTTWLIA